MLYYNSLEKLSMQGVWLAIGIFDGVHIGHQKIIRQLTHEARQAGVQAVVLTFHPHPLVVLANYHDPLYLTTPEKRAELLARLGVDTVITLPFDAQFANQSARQFLGELRLHLGMRQLWAGYNFAMGKNREANASVLEQLGQEFGYTFRVIPAVRVDGQIVSSSQIRELLLQGDVEQAARKLGRPYQIQGSVIKGDGRGRSIGIPTANVQTMAQMVIPARGVYTCWAEARQKRWAAAVNIGVHPTFNHSSDVETRIEAHLLDFPVGEDLYGETVSLEFVTCLRGEIRFNNAQELVTQVYKDVQMARKTLAQKIDAEETWRNLITNGV